MLIKSGATNRHYILALLCLIGIVNYIDRQIVAILLDPIKQELGVSDTAMGLLTGTAFAVCYALASFPIAHLADRWARVPVLAWCVAIWSVLTACCGFAQGFAQLLLFRSGVAVAESGAGPASQALLSDLYSDRSRATVLGVLTAAMTVGIGASMALGGWINVHFGWRTAFMVVGLPGALLAVLMWLSVKEPRAREEVAEDQAAPIRFTDAIKTVLAIPTLRLIMFMSLCAAFSGYALLGWAPTYLVRIHGMSTAQVGLGLGLATVIGAVLGSLASGAVADWLAKRDSAGYAWVIGVGSGICVPLGVCFAFTNSAQSAMIFFGLLQFFKSFWLPAGTAVALILVPPRMRATTSAMISSLNVIGLGLGPLCVGVLNDLLAGRYGTGSIRISLLCAMLGPLLILITSWFFARRVKRDFAARAAVASG